MYLRIDWTGSYLLDRISPDRRSENMRNIRSRDTAPELLVRRIVHHMGYRYRLHVPDLPGKPDMVFPRLKCIIEVRGCFWHQHPGCADAHVPKSRTDYWTQKLDRNTARDMTNEAALRSLGWRLAVIWECELRDIEAVTLRLRAFLAECDAPMSKQART